MRFQSTFVLVPSWSSIANGRMGHCSPMIVLHRGHRTSLYRWVWILLTRAAPPGSRATPGRLPTLPLQYVPSAVCDHSFEPYTDIFVRYGELGTINGMYIIYFQFVCFACSPLLQQMFFVFDLFIVVRNLSFESI